MNKTEEAVVNVTEADFERVVIEQSHRRPVVVDFWAPWCQPCRVLAPILERLVNENAGAVLLAKVNVDEEPGLAAAFNVQGIPTVKAFRDGTLLLEFVGLLPEGQLREFLARLRPSEADQLVKQAAELERVDATKAAQLYQNALQLEPHHPLACIGMARVHLESGRDGDAEELLNRLDIAGEQEAEAERLRNIVALRKHTAELPALVEAHRLWAANPKDARRNVEYGTVLAASGRYREALERLLVAAESDRKLAATQVREMMVRVFQIIGVRDPLADEYRDKLSRLLY